MFSKFRIPLRSRKRLPAAIEAYVKKIAPIMILPGENEMLSLAQGALRVLRGEEQALKF